METEQGEMKRKCQKDPNDPKIEGKDQWSVELEDEGVLSVRTPLVPLTDDKDTYIVLGRSSSSHKKWRRKGLLEIGAVGEHQDTGRDLFGKKVFLDAAFPHIIFICGKRGSGKSYTLGIFAEELMRSAIGVGVIMIDPIGIFWSLKEENRSKREKKVLEKWGLEPHSFPEVKVLVPEGSMGHTSGITDGIFSIGVGEMTAEDWCQVFDVDRFKTQGLLIGSAVDQVRNGYDSVNEGRIVHIKGRKDRFSIGDIVQCMDTSIVLTSKTGGFTVQTRRSIIARFNAAAGWGIFSVDGTPLREMTSANRVTVLDVSDPRLGDEKRSLITGVIARKVLSARIYSARLEEREIYDELDPDLIPVTWLLIDEAHIILPHNRQTPATEALVEYAKQGRRPGCALILATQRPASTSDEILSQVDLLIGHNLALEDDMTALRRRVPAKLPSEFANSDFIRAISVGTAIMADQRTQQRSFLLRVRPRFSHHAGSSAMPRAFIERPQIPSTPIPVSGSYDLVRDHYKVDRPTPFPAESEDTEKVSDQIQGPNDQTMFEKIVSSDPDIGIVNEPEKMGNVTQRSTEEDQETFKEPFELGLKDGSLNRSDLQWMCQVMGISMEGSDTDILSRILDQSIVKDEIEQGHSETGERLAYLMGSARKERQENDKLLEKIDILEKKLEGKTRKKKKIKGRGMVLEWEGKKNHPDVETLVREVQSVKEELEVTKNRIAPTSDPALIELLKRMEEERKENMKRLELMEHVLRKELNDIRKGLKQRQVSKEMTHSNDDSSKSPSSSIKRKERTLPPVEKSPIVPKKKVLKKGKSAVAISPMIGKRTASESAKRNLKRTFLRGPKEMIESIIPLYLPIYRFLIRYKGNIIVGKKEGDLFIDGILGEILCGGRSELGRSKGLKDLLKMTDLETRVYRGIGNGKREDLQISKKASVPLKETRRALTSLQKKGIVDVTSLEGEIKIYSISTEIDIPRRSWCKDPGLDPKVLNGIEEAFIEPIISLNEAERLVHFLSEDISIIQSDIIMYPFYVASIVGEGRERYVAVDGVSGKVDNDLAPALQKVIGSLNRN